MKRALKKTVTVLLILSMTVSLPGCGLDEDAKKTGNSFIVNVLSDKREDLAKDVWSAYEDLSWKKDAADILTSGAKAVLEEEKSSVSKDEDAGSLFYTYTYPDLESIIASEPSSLEELSLLTDKAPVKEKTIEVRMSYKDGKWSVKNGSEVYDAIYKEIYDCDMSFLYPLEAAVIDVGLERPADDLKFTDISSLEFDVTLSEDFIEHGPEYQLSAKLYDADELVLSKDFDEELTEDGKAYMTISSTEIDPKLHYFRQSYYRLDILVNDVVSYSEGFEVQLSRNVFSDKDVLNSFEWLGTDVNGGYYNTTTLDLKLHMDYQYLTSGREFLVTYNVFRDGELISSDMTGVFDGRDLMCTYNPSNENLDTGLYKIVCYNNGTMIGSTEVMVTHNFNEKAYTEPELKTPVDSPEDPSSAKPEPVVIYASGATVPDTLKEYTDVPYKVVQCDMNTYEHTLDAALASGDDAPDLFAVSSDYVSKYANSDHVLPITDLGIPYSDLKYMYEYTFRLSSDNNGVIKGLSWQIMPGAVFYNRQVAATYLGVSEPEDVARYFASWDAFKDTADAVNDMSDGKVKIIANVGDIVTPYMNGRQDPWIYEGKAVMPDYMKDLFDLTDFITGNEMAFEDSRWSSAWSAHMNDRRVLSYWGTLKFGDVFFKPTSTTSWGVVKGPVNYYDGGYWLFSTDYNNMRASSARIMRDLTLDQDNLRKMASKGELVNAINIMSAAAEDESNCKKWLGGQNPYGIFAEIAWQTNVDAMGRSDKQINDIYLDVLYSYLNGEYNNSGDAVKVFEDKVRKAGVA
ncbi:MAG: extracellular solute-binding protein [Clostridiales bacterium]|nr:extracellular solute-binding protein [Clostridiales bacterium]